MQTPPTLADGLQQVLTATNDGLRACVSADPEALHRALDERAALLDACQKLAVSDGASHAQLGSVFVAIKRLSADLESAATRLRDVLAGELASASKAQAAVGDYLAAATPTRRFDRTL